MERSIPSDLIKTMIKDRKVRTAITRKSHWYFFHFYFAHYVKYEIAPFHEEIFNILDNEKIKLAVIVAFRGSAKSTLITTSYVLWSILGIQQKKFIIICGQTEQKARQYLMNIKNELLNNELLRRDLGPFDEEKNSLGNATALIIKRLNVKIMISSVEQSIRGIRHNENRPDLIILDDVEDINSVKTKEGRDKTFNWLTGEVIPAGSNKTRIIAVGNLLHEDSLLKRLQRKIENGEMKRMNAVYKEYPIIDEQGNPLWLGKYPDKESIEFEREKTMNEIAWYREYLLKIISSDEQVVKNDWIQFYKALPDFGLRCISIGIDLAISEKETADYTAMVSGYIYSYGDKMKIYIQPNPINEKITFPVQVERIKNLVAIHKQKTYRVKLYVENVGYQQALVQMFDHNKYDIEGVAIGRSDKKTRLQLTTPLLKDGRILFPEKGCEELIEQLIGFGKEKHDDLVDAFTMLVLKVIENNPKRVMSGTGRPDAI
jgi:predicted phage terminase large subunit-like protein